MYVSGHPLEKFANVMSQFTLKGDMLQESEANQELDEEGQEKVLKLVDALDDLDDVQDVYYNLKETE